MVEHGKIDGCPFAVTGYGGETFLNVSTIRGEETGFRHNPGEGVCVVCEYIPPGKPGFDDRCTTATEWIVYNITFPGQEIDEEPWKLWFEACTIGYFMD
jgi:hypothetical protein